MHLKEISISGFKTFVDFTKIKLSPDLICVVGPNGCGKSNILDAIRWVLGESSNKLIRTNVNDDVIFAGAKGRNKSDRASVELIFDNHDKKVKGQFAEFTQISIKRELNREEPSKYFINNQKVRRKDIHTIFMGTGLGANSYALIQQGLISQIVESKPDELREMIEEAAQISGYKQRRHETSLKIKNTFENLSRVGDLQYEIEKQSNYLKNQASAAKRYHHLKEQIFETKLQMIALSYQHLSQQKADFKSKNLALDAESEKIKAQTSSLETALIKQKNQQNEVNQSKESIEKQRYEKAKEIARLEEKIKQIEFYLSSNFENRKNLSEQISAAQKKLTLEKENQQAAKTRIRHLSHFLNEQAQKLETKQYQFDEVQKARELLSYEFAGVESQKNNLKSSIQARLNQSEQFKKTLLQQKSQLEKITKDISQIEITKINKKIHDLKNEIQSIEVRKLNALESVSQVSSEYEIYQNQFSETKDQLNDLNQKLHSSKAKIIAANQLIISLEGKALTWSKNKLKENQIDFSLLAESIKLDTKLKNLLEAMLPELQAIMLKNKKAENQAIQWLKNEIESKQTLELEWFVNRHFDSTQEKNHSINSNQAISLPCLIDICQQHDLKLPYQLANQLSHIFIASDISSALKEREKLGINQSIFSEDGIWLSKDRLKVIDIKTKLSNSPLQVREKLAKDKKELDFIEKEINTLNQLKADLSIKREKLQLQKTDAMRQVEIENSAFNQKTQNLAHLKQQLVWQTERLDSLKNTQANLKQSILENERELSQIENLDNEQEKIALEHQFHHLGQKREQMEFHFREKKNSLDLLKNEVQKHRESLSSEKLKSDYINQNIERITKEIESYDQKLQELNEKEHENQSQDKQLLDKKLNEKLIYQQKIETQIKTHNEQLEKIASEVNNLEVKLAEQKESFYKLENHKNRIEIELKQTQQLQEECLKDLLRLEKNNFRTDDKHETLENTDQGDKEIETNSEVNLETKIQTMQNHFADISQDDRETKINDFKDEIERLELKVSKMTSINLNAIEDYEASKKKLSYLNHQREDIEEALKTLKQAIYKIDKQTRSMFESTFNQINQHFSEFFPALFGGGSAKLILTEEDMLTSGVIIDAKPFGKKNKQISMLSGGEKALTALALVFSFFSLNPAPFCLLDEVDAPLDDYNTLQFTKLIKQKSSEVQFICITHNKQTMQIATQLLGVTMKEPGVSKVVSVDINKAIEMAV